MGEKKNQDIRWHQRLASYKKALKQLVQAVELSAERPLSDLEEQGLVKAFEFTYEQAWLVMKDYFDHQGANGIAGSRDAFREAFANGLITEGHTWMDMIKSRQLTAHTYNADDMEEVAEKVAQHYTPLFIAFQKTMDALRNTE